MNRKAERHTRYCFGHEPHEKQLEIANRQLDAFEVERERIEPPLPPDITELLASGAPDRDEDDLQELDDVALPFLIFVDTRIQ